MSIALFITGSTAPLLLMLSPLSVISVGLARDAVDGILIADVRKGKGGKISCGRPRYRLM